MFKENKSPLHLMLSKFYQVGLVLRHHAYDQGWFASEKVPACVVSIGNIACGGTGKTPIVQKLAKELSAHRKVAILIRGYRGGAEHFDPPCLVSEGDGPLVDAALAGDEAFLHASALPGVSVWASKYRTKAAHLAIENGAEIILLDDGMQHRRLKRDIEIAVIDGCDDLLKQKFLPSGRLRDLPQRLKFAHAVIVHHAPEVLDTVFQQLRTFTDAPFIATRMMPTAESKKRLSGRKVAMFCAIGRPERFEATLKNLKADVVLRLCLRDHSEFEQKELGRFAEEAKKEGAEVLVCTRKDFVKLPSALNLPIVVLDAEVGVVEGQNSWENLLQQILLQTEQRRRVS